MPDGRVTWTVLDARAEPVALARGWIVHLEQIHQAPSTIRCFARHVAELGEFLTAHEKKFEQITIQDYDQFLAWFERRRTMELSSPKLIPLHRPAPGRTRVSASLRNQVHMAVKSFYRHVANSERFEFDARTKLRQFDGERAYKTFLEHISRRRYMRRRDPYRQGSVDAAQKTIAMKRLLPEQVLALVRACHLVRDAFLVVLMYNTGIRIGEALGLHQIDVDISGKVIWIVPRADNEKRRTGEDQSRARSAGARIRRPHV